LENDNPGSNIRLLITAPFPAIRAGLRSLVETDAEINVVAESASPLEWGSHFARFDVILIAPIGSISADWRAIIKEKAPPTAPILFLLSQSLSALPDLGKRAWGALPFSSSSAQIILAIRALFEGFWIAQPELLPQAFTNATSIYEQPDALLESLTKRESDVLQCLALGYTNKETAHQLHISVQTVKFHITSIYTKLSATNRTEAVRIGVRQGLVNL
jgi:two-component system, NarL family, response regulator YdfI